MMSETLYLLAGSLLSLLFEYVPGLHDRYNDIKDRYQQTVMLAALAVVSLAVFGLSCAGWMDGLWPELAVSCDQAGIQELVKGFILALVANQATHRILPK